MKGHEFHYWGLYGERLLLPGGKAGGGKKLVLHGEDRGSDRRFSPPVLSVQPGSAGRIFEKMQNFQKGTSEMIIMRELDKKAMEAASYRWNHIAKPLHGPGSAGG